MTSAVVELSPEKIEKTLKKSKLTRLTYEQLEGEEIQYFMAALKTDEHAAPLKWILDLIDRSRYQLWKWSDEDALCIFITEVVQQPDGQRELFIKMCAGNAISEKFVEAAQDFMEIVRDAKCIRIIAHLKREILDGLIRRAKEHGVDFAVKESYVVASIELSDFVSDELEEV